MFGLGAKKLSKEMALLLLLWQEACLEHDVENDELLPGAKSATLDEEKVLDSVYEREQIKESWDDFNKAYTSFSSAADRTVACIKVLAETDLEYRVKVIRYALAMAAASFENDSDNPISETEAKFIDSLKSSLNVRDEDIG